jgi:peptide/nickel transport system substrate-binding protein
MAFKDLASPFAPWIAALGFALAITAAAQAQTLQVAVPANDMGTLDPDRATATPDINLVNWIFNGLVRMKPGTANPEMIEPDLATTWTSSPDKKVWTFTLRNNVQCQGGFGPLTADDVVFSLQRAANKNASSFFTDYAAIQSVQAPDTRTVKITLNETVPNLLSLLVPYHGGNIVCRKAVEKLGAAFGRRPIGTGPFEVVDYRPQQYVTLQANDKYFRGAPHIKKILFHYMISDSSRDLAFQTGEIDMVSGRYDDLWLKRIARLPGTTVDVMGPTELHTLYLNMSRKPLDDIRVRQAIAHAIDRNALVSFRGATLSKPADSVIPNGYLGHVSVPLLGHDVAEAKRLLAAAGYPNGLTIKAIQTTLPAMLTTMQVVQSQLKSAGINLELTLVDHPAFHAQIRQDLSQIVYYGAARFPIADTYLSQFFDSASSIGKPTAVTNFSHCNAADAEIRAAHVEPDPDKQKALWATAQKKINDAVCAVPMYEMGQPWAWKNKLVFGTKITGSLGLSPPIDETTRLGP